VVASGDRDLLPGTLLNPSARTISPGMASRNEISSSRSFPAERNVVVVPAPARTDVVAPAALMRAVSVSAPSNEGSACVCLM